MLLASSRKLVIPVRWIASWGHLAHASRAPCVALIAILVALWLAAPAAAQTANETDNSNSTGYTVPTSAANLLSTLNGGALTGASSAAASGAESTSTDWGILTDGSYGIVGGAAGFSSTKVAIGNETPSPTTLTYTLASIGAPSGYTINSVDVYTGWQDNGRIAQSWSILYSTVSDPFTFLNLATVATATGPNGTNSFWVDLSVSGLNNVGAIEFSFPDGNAGGTSGGASGQQNNYVGYAEVAVGGVPGVVGSAWTGMTDTNWTTNGNWSGSVPGATGGSTANTDGALFNQAATHQPVIIDPGRNLQYITFDTANVPAMTIGANPAAMRLPLTSGARSKPRRRWSPRKRTTPR